MRLILREKPRLTQVVSHEPLICLNLILDVSGEQNSRQEVKKMVPRLKIDMVPSHHLKNQKANTNSLSNLHMQSSASLTSSKSTSKLSTRQLGSATFSQNSASHLMSQVAHLLESGSQKILKNK